MKRIIKYPGSKWTLAKTLVSYFPPHTAYIEPYFGSGALFFSKEKCNLEILNDINGEVVNAFKVIRDSPDQLMHGLRFTPYARDEYYNSESLSDDSVERARRFIVNSNMAIGGTQIYKTGWRHSGLKRAITTAQSVARDWKTIPDGILEVSERLKDAEVENTDAIKLIEKYDYNGALFYIDPPYLLETRKGKYYDFEMGEIKEHEKLLDILIKSKAMVMISGYDHELYNTMLSDWTRLEFGVFAEKGTKRTEVVWCNWDVNEQLKLF